MRLRNVTFANWLRSHSHKIATERWLRELYPWPVLAQVDYGESRLNQPQELTYDGVAYQLILKSIRWQQDRGTYRYRVRVESEGLGWHARSFADLFDVCATREGEFVTLFHASAEEPLEKIARAFFGKQWGDLGRQPFKTLAVSRFLAAALAGQIAEEALGGVGLEHYPDSRIVAGSSPMLAKGSEIWVGYRFFSEGAYDWARRHAGNASRVICVYFADSLHQIRTDLPPGAEVHSAAQLDAGLLAGRYDDLVRALLRRLELPTELPSPRDLDRIVRGYETVPASPATEGDVLEALAAIKRPCDSKAELRYQLAAAVLLNAWIESERRLGFVERKKFYAFKQRVDLLARWAADKRLPGVELWAESSPIGAGEVLFIRIDGVDFSFHNIPFARSLVISAATHPAWSGVRLKPIGPLVLAWARGLRDSE